MKYNICAFGATSDDTYDNTRDIQQAIDTCSEEGGGQVYVPPGLYMIGSLELKSGVELYIERGAILRGIFDAPGYISLSERKPDLTGLIFARGAQNIGIAGSGCIDAQGSRYWRKVDKPRTGRADFLEVGAAQFWYEHIQDLNRPSRLLLFWRCVGVKITDISLMNATAWTCHLLASRDVKIHRINISNPVYGPNTDGIDIDGSSDVIISDSTIATGDDAVVLKTTNYLNDHTPIRNVLVSNCRFTTGCNGIKIGTETEEAIENVACSNITIYNADECEQIERCITGIAIESVDGGPVRNIACHNITMINCRTPFFLRLGNRMRGGSTQMGAIRGVSLSHIIATGATHPSVISGIPEFPIEDLQISQVQIETKGGVAESVDDILPVPEHSTDYPEVFMFGVVPASVFYVRHVKRVNLTSVFTTLREADARPLLYLDDVHDEEIDKRLNLA